MQAFFRRLLPCACVCGALLTAQGCSDGEPRACTAIGCGPVLVARVNLAATTPAGADVSACRTGPCAHATLPAERATAGAGVGVAFSGPGAPPVQGLLSTRPDGSLQLEVDFLQEVAPEPPLTNGDVYSVEVTSGGGLIAMVQGAATYEASRPNGEGCPPVCQTAGAIGDAP